MEQTAVDAFTEFVREVEPRLKRALVAAFGRDAGLEATADALAFAWEQWDRVRSVDNPAGYLWGVGRNKARRAKKRRPLFPEVPDHHEPWIEPGLPGAIAGLTWNAHTIRLEFDDAGLVTFFETTGHLYWADVVQSPIDTFYEWIRAEYPDEAELMFTRTNDLRFTVEAAELWQQLMPEFAGYLGTG